MLAESGPPTSERSLGLHATHIASLFTEITNLELRRQFFLASSASNPCENALGVSKHLNKIVYLWLGLGVKLVL